MRDHSETSNTPHQTQVISTTTPLAEWTDISARLCEATSLTDLADLAISYVLQLTGMESGVIYHADRSLEPHGNLRRLSYLQKPGSRIYAPEIAFSRDTVADISLHNRQTIATPDARQDDHYGRRMIAHGVCCGVTVPLIARGYSVGLLQVADSEANVYPVQSVAEVEALSRLLAICMDNIALQQKMERRERIAAELVVLGFTLSETHDEAELFALICQQSAPIFGMAGARLWIGSDSHLVLTTAYGNALDIPIGTQRANDDPDFFAGQVMRERRPLLNYIQTRPELVPAGETPGYCKRFGVPLMRGNQTFGVLVLSDTNVPKDVVADDLEQLQLLGVQVALAIENTRLLAEIRHRLDQLRLVNEAGRIATSGFELNPLLQKISTLVFEEFRFHAFGVLMMSGGQLIVHSLFIEQLLLLSQADSLPKPALPPNSTAYLAVGHDETILSHHAATLSRWVRAEPSDEPLYEIAMPLIVAGEVLGVLNFESRRRITADDLDVLEPLAAQLAFSVSNGRLFELTQAQMLELDSRVHGQTLEIREQKEHIEAILHSVADAVITTDLTGQILSRNPAAETFFREAARLVQGDETIEAQVAELVMRLINDDQQEQTAMLDLGMWALQAKAGRVRESDQDVGSVIVFRDITPLREIDRLKTQFVSTVSHELRTPLSNIKLYLSLLQTGRPQKQAHYYAIMEQETSRLERLISDLLDLSRLEQKRLPRQKEALDLVDLVLSAVMMNMETAEARALNLAVLRPTDVLPMVQGDRDELMQVILNLLANALNYTPANGSVTVICDNLETSIRISVTDTGIGINEVDLPHIFDRFYRGANVKKYALPGTGLGLAICKEIVTLHGGQIGVDNQPDKGCTFWFTIPVMPDEQKRLPHE